MCLTLSCLPVCLTYGLRVQVPSAHGEPVPLPSWVLTWAASRADQGVQMEMMMLVAEHPQGSTAPDAVEQALVTSIITQSMRGSACFRVCLFRYISFLLIAHFDRPYRHAHHPPCVSQQAHDAVDQGVDPRAAGNRAPLSHPTRQA